MLDRWAIRNPGVIEVAPDLIEAYVRSGEIEKAREETFALERAAAHTGNVSASAAALRYRGLLDEGGQVDGLFLAALEEHDRLPRPFERARTELCFGERLRRARRKSDAREHLEVARGSSSNSARAPGPSGRGRNCWRSVSAPPIHLRRRAPS